MNCIILTPTNKGESSLYNVLNEFIANGNESKANELYSFFLSDRFKRQFGDWQQDYKNGLFEKYKGRINDSFEPLIFKDENGKFFFLNSENERVSYPYNEKSLIDSFEEKTLSEVVNKLSTDFIVDVLGFSYDKINTNVDNVNTDVNKYLKETLKNKIEENESKLDEFEEREDYDSPEYDRLVVAEPLLNDLLESVDELTDLVKNRISENKIRLKETIKESVDKEGNTEIVSEEDSPKDTYWSSTSAYRQVNVRSNAKLALSLIPDLNSSNTVLGGHNYLSFDEVYPSLLRILSDNRIIYENGNVVHPYNEIIKRLRSLVSKKPQFGKLLDIFLDTKKYPDDLRLSLYQAFNTQRNNPLAVEVTEIGKDDIYSIKYNNRDISAATSTATKTRKDWNYRFFEKHLADRSKNISDVIKPLQDVITNLKNVQNQILKSKNIDSSLNNVFEGNQKTVFENTIDTYINTFNTLFNHNLNRKATIDLLLDDNMSIYDNALTTTNVLILELSKMIDPSSKDNIQEVFKTNNTHNRLIEGPAIFTKFAEAEAEYGNSDSNATTNTNKGKLYLHSNPSHVGSIVSMWKSNPSMLKEWFKNDVYAKSSIFARKMLQIDSFINPASLNDAIKETINKFKIITFTDYYRKSKTKSRDKKGSASEMTQQEYSVDYFNKVLLNRLDPVNGVPVKSTLMADKSTDIHLQFPFFSKAVQSIDNQTGEITFNKDLNNVDNNPIELFKQHFFVEVNRMILAGKTIKKAIETNKFDTLKQHYHYSKLSKNEDGTHTFKHGNALRSQLFPELSYDYEGGYHTPRLLELAEQIKKALYEGEYISDVIGDRITENSKYVLDNTERSDLNQLIEEYIEETLKNRISENYEFFKNEGVFNNTPSYRINTLTGEKQRAIGTYNNIDESLVQEYSKFFNYKTIDLAMMADFYINATLRNIEYSKLFTGDFAYYKNLDDYHKRAPATLTDGVMPLIREGEESFSYAVMRAAEIESPFYDRLVEMLGEDIASRTYSNINSNDAQAYITPKRWKQLMSGINWSNAHETLYNKMIEGSLEPYTSEELDILAQPLKGVYFWKSEQGEPLYFKYSQAVLTPLLVKGTGMEAVYNRMMDSENGFDELLTSDAVKVGSPLQTEIHDEIGDINNIDFNVQQADARGWKLQQELTPHGVGPTDIGSQIQKNIFSLIKHHGEQSFTSPSGQTKTGQELVNDIVKYTKAKSDLGKKQIFKDLGVNEEGIITNQERLYESLIDEVKDRGGDPNIIDALNKRVPLDALPQLRHQSNILISSMIDKKIVKIKTNGGAFIQMSNFGLSFNEASVKESGIKLHPDLNNLTEGKYKTFEPFISKEVNKEGKRTITPGGVFISGSFIAEHIPDWKSKTSEELFGYTNEEGKRVNGIIDNRILENVIGYRIPNQGLSSNDALQIVGILPESYGDTIVAYTGITAKTGSDFDIDKMFLMIPSFRRVLDEKQKRALSDYISTQFRGDTVRETITNIFDKAKELDLNLDIDIDLKQKNSNHEEFISKYNKLKDLFVDAVLSSDNLHNTGVKSLIDKFTNEGKRTDNFNPAIDTNFNDNSKKEITDFHKSNKELSKIGSAEEYQEYLSTIFPDSKVQDVVYHGTGRRFESFSDDVLGSNTNALSANLGHFFTNNKELATLYSAYNGAASKFEMTNDIKGRLIKFVKSLDSDTTQNIIYSLLEANQEVTDITFDVAFNMQQHKSALEGQNILEDPVLEQMRNKYQAALAIEEQINMLKEYISELQSLNSKNLSNEQLSDELDKFMSRPVPMLLQAAKPVGDLMMAFSLSIGKDIIPNLAPGKQGLDLQYDRQYKHQQNVHKNIAYNQLVYKDGKRIDPESQISEGVVKYGYDKGSVVKTEYVKDDSGMLTANFSYIVEDDISSEIPAEDLADVNKYYDNALSKITEDYNANKARIENPEVKLALLNMKNPTINDDKGSRLHTSKMTDRFIENATSENDSHILKNTYDPYLNDVHIVKSSDQIHLLGSKKDVEGFKEFKNRPISEKKSIFRLQYETKPGTDGYFSNKLIETYKHILADPDIIKEVMQSIDSSYFKDAIQSLTPKNKSSKMSLYHMEPKNEIETVYSFRAGKAGVGIEANSMVDINRTGELSIKRDALLPISHLIDNFNVEDNNVVLDKEFSRPLDDSVVRYFANKVGIKDVDTFSAELKDVRTVSSMVAILNGFVDIAKDPYITQGGWDTSSTNFGNTLLRMGMNPLKVITLMMQPAIRAKFTKGREADLHLIKQALVSEDSSLFRPLSEIDNASGIYEYLKENNENLYEKLNKVVNDSFIANNNLLDLNSLLEPITGEFKLAHLTNQLNILNFGETISEITKEIKLNIEVSRTDTDGLNGSIANIHVLNNKINKLNRSTVLEGIDSKFKDSVLAVYKDNLSDVFDMAQNNPHLFPEVSKTNLNVVDYVANVLSNEDVLSNEVLKEINDALYSVKMQQFFELDSESTVKLLKELPARFNEFKDKYSDDYLILKELSVKSVASTNLNGVNGLINLNSRERTGVEKAKITNSWDRMLKDHPEISEDLIKYAYASTNFNFTPTQFYELIPTSYYINKDITKFIKEYDNRNIDLISLVNHLVKNSLEASKLVPYIGKSHFKTIKGKPHVKINMLSELGPHLIKSSNNSLAVTGLFSDESVDLDGVSYLPVYSVNQLGTSIDGTAISLFKPYIPSNETTKNAIKEMLEDKQSIFSRGQNKTLEDVTNETDSEILEVFNEESNKSSRKERVNLIESYRDKLNSKIGSTEASALLNELLFSDLTLSEIEQELKNCI